MIKLILGGPARLAIFLLLIVFTTGCMTPAELEAARAAKAGSGMLHQVVYDAAKSNCTANPSCENEACKVYNPTGECRKTNENIQTTTISAQVLTEKNTAELEYLTDVVSQEPRIVPTDNAAVVRDMLYKIFGDVNYWSSYGKINLATYTDAQRDKGFQHGIFVAKLISLGTNATANNRPIKNSVMVNSAPNVDEIIIVKHNQHLNCSPPNDNEQTDMEECDVQQAIFIECIESAVARDNWIQWGLYMGKNELYQIKVKTASGVRTQNNNKFLTTCDGIIAGLHETIDQYIISNHPDIQTSA